MCVEFGSSRRNSPSKVKEMIQCVPPFIGAEEQLSSSDTCILSCNVKSHDAEDGHPHEATLGGHIRVRSTELPPLWGLARLPGSGSGCSEMSDAKENSALLPDNSLKRTLKELIWSQAQFLNFFLLFLIICQTQLPAINRRGKLPQSFQNNQSCDGE